MLCLPSDKLLFLTLTQMEVNPCHPIKSAPQPPNFTETSCCQMPFVEIQNSPHIIESPYWAASILQQNFCVYYPLSYYSSAPHEQMSNRMLQQGRMAQWVMNASLHEFPIMNMNMNTYLVTSNSCVTIMSQNNTFYYFTSTQKELKKTKHKWRRSGDSGRSYVLFETLSIKSSGKYKEPAWYFQ